jgi:predicted DsbA family dithiol-disulfide isomerase
MLAHLRQVAARLDLPFGQRTMTFNSRFAQELGKWAEEQGRGDQFHRAAFRAYFAEGQNIGDREVLAAAARSAGLSDRKAREVIDSRAYKQAVDDDWQYSTRSGVTAVPTFQLDGDRLVGAQPTAVLEQFLVDHDVPRQSQRPAF